jgi:hypothetical protein
VKKEAQDLAPVTSHESAKRLKVESLKLKEEKTVFVVRFSNRSFETLDLLARCRLLAVGCQPGFFPANFQL